MTYTLTRSFSHASHGAGHAPSSHIATYVPVTGVPNPRPLKTRDLEAGTCMLDVIGPQTWVDGVGVTASSISRVGPFSHVAILLSCVVSLEFKQLVPAHKEHIQYNTYLQSAERCTQCEILVCVRGCVRV